MSPDEIKVQSFLAEHSLEATSYSKLERRSGKKPDFRVLKGGAFAFFCEVKSIEADDVVGLRNDPIFNRLADDIHTAVKQFDAVNPDRTYPNVLAFVNHDSACGPPDLIGVTTGQFVSEGGRLHKIYTQYSDGRIKDEKKRIDLFIWLDDCKLRGLLWSQAHDNHHQALCRVMGVNPSDIRTICT
ncbi:MAG TPA: hypothetical protein VLI06_03300 [Solimonas sp.]|nr:hypothetical protein [Solimonas sp.]